jgi:hypothetical protein
MSASKSTSAPDSKHTAGLLDIRTIIGSLLGVYGVILTLVGLFGDEEADKTGGVNANLWSGLVLLVGGLAFLAWARLRPVTVPEGAADHDRGEEVDRGHHADHEHDRDHDRQAGEVR